jgi:threonine dehydrogenase-like Zn-dependent dehydrogenase
MRAVVFHGIGDIRLEDVPDPTIKEPTDAIVRLTASAICGTDLHMIRGTLSGVNKGRILGHEGVGIVEEVGKDVRNFRRGDRVVIPSTIGCGNCVYCRDGYYALCNEANPNAPGETAFYGGPEEGGGYDGMQAELVRVPFASVNLYGLPPEIDDDSAILLSDIFPTAYMAAEFAEIKPGNTVAVFGCGPVGQFAIASAKLFRAGRVFAIDTIPSRLEMARAQGAEAIDFNKENPVKAIKKMTGDIGVDRAIDCVGVDADRPHHGKGAAAAEKQAAEFEEELEKIAPKTNEDGDNWHPGDAPSQVLNWAVDALAKAGTLSIVGVYSGESKTFPIGNAMAKNLTVKMGNCNHRKYIPYLIQLVRSGVVDPSEILTQQEPLTSAIEAYKQFDLRQPGWIKVKLEPQSLRGEKEEAA